MNSEWSAATSAAAVSLRNMRTRRRTGRSLARWGAGAGSPSEVSGVCGASRSTHGEKKNAR